MLSNSIHLAADTGRVIACPFIPGKIPDAAMAFVVRVGQPEAWRCPNLFSGFPAALDEPIGNIGANALRDNVSVTALVT